MSETVQYCSRCGKPFRRGQTRYLMTVSLVADFDGHIEADAGPGAFERMWREIEKKSEEELINEVAQKMSFILCKPCRDAWVNSPLGDAENEKTPLAGHVH